MWNQQLQNLEAKAEGEAAGDQANGLEQLQQPLKPQKPGGEPQLAAGYSQYVHHHHH